MSEIIPGVNSANSRRRKVQVFLQKPPKGATTLTMMAAQQSGDGGVLQLGEWEKEDVVPELADEILTKLDEHATEMGGSIQCTLTFTNTAGKALATHVLKRQSNHVENPLDGAELTARMLAGDNQAERVHATASSLALQKVYMSGIVNLMGFQERAAERAELQNVELRKQVARLEVERDSLNRELAEASAAILAMQGGDEGEAPSPAQVEALGLLKQVMPLLMARLMQQAPGAMPS
jgi:hypothetical protein